MGISGITSYTDVHSKEGYERVINHYQRLIDEEKVKEAKKPIESDLVLELISQAMQI